ncbi:hypothetical protein Ddc_23274 [Ditylenchus destructor]|nr:hypothetical protein Ddc_23274 [Ditylenchus destructor]
MHLRKIAEVLQLDASNRCDYFVRKVADFEMVWGLHDSGWATAIINGYVVIPFWPEEAFAAMCAADEWAGYRAIAIPIDGFLSNWLSGMQRDKRLCLVFPTPKQVGCVLLPTELKSLIQQELQQYK